MPIRLAFRFREKLSPLLSPGHSRRQPDHAVQTAVLNGSSKRSQAGVPGLVASIG